MRMMYHSPGFLIAAYLKDYNLDVEDGNIICLEVASKITRRVSIVTGSLIPLLVTALKTTYEGQEKAGRYNSEVFDSIIDCMTGGLPQHDVYFN